MGTKIHKVMKAIGRMSNVPGDNEFSFKKRCADLLTGWRTTLENYRMGRRIMELNEGLKSNDATERLPTGPMATSLGFAEATMSKQAGNTQDDKLNSAGDTGPAPEDDQVDRVELATETMRQQLLEIGLLPPAERPLGGVYTRADVLEAYIQKFNELKSMIGQSGDGSVEPTKLCPSEPAKPDLYHDFDQLEATRTLPLGQRLSLDEFYFNERGRRTENGLNEGPSVKTGNPASDLLGPSLPKSAKDSGRFPKKAVSFDHLAVEIGRDVRHPTEAGTKEPGRAPMLKEPPSTQWHNESPTPAPKPSLPSPTSAESPEMNWSMSYYPSELSRQVRHRQSWYPAPTPAPSHDARYPFSFSPSDVMARYPPISQINQNPHVPTSFSNYLPTAPSGVANQIPYRPLSPLQPSMTPNEPTLWRSSTFSTNSGQDRKGEAPSPAGSNPWGQPRIIIKPEVHNAARLPERPPMGAAAQRSTSTRITRAEQEKLRGEKQQRKAGRFAERRRRRLEGEWEPRPTAEQLAEEGGKEGEIQKCVEQLTGMGFARGKSDAVATAVLGNLEMALDVLNEDSAAWEAKAKQDERREMRREREDVPGSWGSWDDELYG